MRKSYNPIGFEDSPSTKTPLSAATLNVLDNGIDRVEDNTISEFQKVGYGMSYSSNKLRLLNADGDTLTEVTITSGGGGGEGGTDNYDDLFNRPQINGKTLTGNMTLSTLGIASADELYDLQQQVGDAAAKLDNLI